MTDAQLKQLFAILFPDNDNREISEKDLRDGLAAFLDTISARIGSLPNLDTHIKVSLVRAVNELVDRLSFLEDRFAPEFGEADPNITPPPGAFDYGSLYIQQQVLGGDVFDVGYWVYTNVQGVGWLNLTGISQTVVYRADHYEDLPPVGNLNYIYLVEDTGNTYVWNNNNNEYQLVGSVIEGTLIDEHTFEDLDGDPVIPDGGNLYLDTTSGLYYRYVDGSYVAINENPEIDWSYLTNQKHLKYDSLTGKPEDSNVSDTATGISVDGDVRGKGFIGKSVSANVASSYVIDLNDIAEHYILAMTDNTSISFSNMISNVESVVISLTVTGSFSMVLPAFLKPSPDNDDYDGSMNNEIVINIKKGGTNPLGYYTLKSYEI